MVISVMSREAGQAKTTTVAHIATVLSRRGNTVVIDDDQRKGARSLEKIITTKQPRTAYTLDVQQDGESDAKRFERLSKNYHSIILDSEGQIDDARILELAGADMVIVPTGLEETDLDAAAEMMQMLQKIGNPKAKIRPPKHKLLFTQVSDKELYRHAYHEFAVRHKYGVFKTCIPYCPEVAALSTKGLTAFDNVSNDDIQAVADAYEAVCEQVIP
ncbi:MAG: ParA family protein [Deinococcota bacterium]